MHDIAVLKDQNIKILNPLDLPSFL